VLSRQCSGITREGRRCTVSVNGAQEFCHLHDPARSEERRRQASKAGRARGNRGVAVLKEELKTVIGDVKSGDLDRNDAAVMIQGYRALKDFISLERQIRETDELAAEIEEMREILGARRSQEKSWAG
jgi:hypothetical protein